MIVVDVVVREYIEPGSPRARPGSRPNLPETPPRAVGQASAGGRCVGLEVVIQTDSSPGAAHLESLSVLSAKHTHTNTFTHTPLSTRPSTPHNQSTLHNTVNMVKAGAGFSTTTHSL
jgi:hypothetical protein